MIKNKFLSVLILCISMMVCLPGCGLLEKIVTKDGHVEVITAEASHGIYQMNLDETRIVKVPYEANATTTAELIEGYIEALKKKPSDNAYKSVITGNVHVVSYEYSSSDRLVTLYFAPSYENLTPTCEILTRAAIVKTLTQFNDDIQYVSFVVGEVPLTAKDGSPLLMRGRDFVSSIGGSMEYVREDYVTMYFVREDGEKLQSENVIVKYSSTINLETAIVNSLISGPITKGLKPALSLDTQVNKVNVKEGICYVDLDEKFLERVSDQSFQLNIYSVVNTLTQIPGITRVQFLIDGEIFTGKVEGLRIDGLFEKDMSIVYRPEKMNVSGNSDITKDIEQFLEEQNETTRIDIDGAETKATESKQTGE